MTSGTSANAFGISGWEEVVFSVRSLDHWINFWQAVGGWKALHRGPLSEEWTGGWGLQADAEGEVALIAQPGSEAGFIRLVSIAGADQQMRSNARVWDTGGWFDINVRVHDIKATLKAVQAQGWTALSEPVEMNMGPVRVIEWLTCGPDGIVVAFIERLAPPLSGFPDFDTVSRSFNATQIVADEAVSQDWYEKVLGFEVFIDTEGPGADGGPNVFGLPYNLIQDIPSRLVLLHPQGLPIGSMELCRFKTLEGRDFSASAGLPNLGVASLRFPVTDIDKLITHLRGLDDEVKWISTPAERPFEPFGQRVCFTIAGPNGEWLEFFEISS